MPLTTYPISKQHQDEELSPIEFDFHHYEKDINNLGFDKNLGGIMDEYFKSEQVQEEINKASIHYGHYDPELRLLEYEKSEQVQTNLLQILEKFNSKTSSEKFQKSALFNQIAMLLSYRDNPYLIIEQLIEMIETYQKEYEYALQMSGIPKNIRVDNENKLIRQLEKNFVNIGFPMQHKAPVVLVPNLDFTQDMIDYQDILKIGFQGTFEDYLKYKNSFKDGKEI